MTQFIKLTRPSGHALLQNINLTFAFAEDADKTTSVFEVGKDPKCFVVKETLEQILALIEGGGK